LSITDTACCWLRRFYHVCQNVFHKVCTHLNISSVAPSKNESIKGNRHQTGFNIIQILFSSLKSVILRYVHQLLSQIKTKKEKKSRRRKRKRLRRNVTHNKF
jgi:hypothetical protein